MPSIKLEIKNCLDCTLLKQVRVYTEDSFERDHDWFCGKHINIDTGQMNKIAGSVSWNEGNKIPVPEWCPILIKE